MKTKHTPGPWEINGGHIQHTVDGYHTPDNIAIVGRVNSQRPLDTANARLIAAAPDLLDACKKLLTDCLNANCSCDHQGEESLRHDESCLVTICGNTKKAEAAIAKAEKGQI